MLPEFERLMHSVTKPCLSLQYLLLFLIVYFLHFLITSKQLFVTFCYPNTPFNNFPVTFFNKCNDHLTVTIISAIFLTKLVRVQSILYF